ncbi:MAG: hypothetical protein BWY19_00779 [bacterium ADurb.Bin212]|nr:MAG: hypothetical protein BWY19_00779 [bacterium ADurb.Bin212]
MFLELEEKIKKLETKVKILEEKLGIEDADEVKANPKAPHPKEIKKQTDQKNLLTR